MKRLLSTPLWLLAWYLWTCAATVAVGQHLYPEMTREEVMKTMGPPRNRLTRGSLEVLHYQEGIKLTLRDGRLDFAEGIELGRQDAPSVVIEEVVENPSVAPEPTGTPFALAKEKAEIREIVAVASGETVEPVKVEAAAPPQLSDRLPVWDGEEESESALTKWVGVLIIFALNAVILFFAIQLGYNFASVSGQTSEVWRVALAFALFSGLIDLLPISGHFAMMLFWGIIFLKSVVMVILLRLLTYLRSAGPIFEIAVVSMVAHTVVSVWIGAFVVSLVHGLFF